MKIVLATGNRDKISEIRNILKDTVVELVGMDEFDPISVVEDGKTFFANARKKALQFDNKIITKKYHSVYKNLLKE